MKSDSGPQPPLSLGGPRTGQDPGSGSSNQLHNHTMCRGPINFQSTGHRGRSCSIGHYSRFNAYRDGPSSSTVTSISAIDVPAEVDFCIDLDTNTTTSCPGPEFERERTGTHSHSGIKQPLRNEGLSGVFGQLDQVVKL